MIEQILLDGILIGGIYAAFAVGFSLVFGVINVVNLAHGEFIMLGSFITYWLFQLYHIEPFLTIPVSFGILFVLGYYLQKYLINPIVDAELMTLLLTFGLMMVIANTALTVWTPDYRSVEAAYVGANFPFMGLTVSYVRLVTFVAAIVIIVGLTMFLQKTDVGRAIRATAQNRERAILLGINSGRIYSLTFAIGAALAGVAGSLLSLSFVIFAAMGSEYLLFCFCITVLGGMGYIPGALLGGMLLGVINSVCTYYLTVGMMYVIVFIILFVILVVRPTGLFGKGRME